MLLSYHQTTRHRKTARLLISCPTCAAGYNVPDAVLAGAGRLLRCARCATEFQASLPAPEPVPVMFEPPVVEPVVGPLFMPVVAPEIAAPVVRPSRVWMIAALLSWAFSLGLLASIGWGAVHWRSQVMAAWPPSERLFQAVGLD